MKDNKGTGGIDEVSINNIVACGEDKFLKEIQEELKENKYRKEN